VTPSVVWGIGIGLVIALVDAVTTFLIARPAPSEWPITEVNIMLNVMLYTIIGFRVGKATGLVRDAAEGCVLAGFLVSAVGIAFLWVLRPAVGGIDSSLDVVGLMAQNVALGGLIGIVAGWLGSRTRQDSASSRF
jgi:hypothetical protein